MTLRILAIDPALSNVGFARLIVAENGGLLVKGLRLIRTASEAGKTTRKNSDDLRRANIAWEAMEEEVEAVDLIAAEIPSGTQSARGAMSNGISLGLLAALSFKKPLIQVTAAEAKKAATGRSTATKSEMIKWAHDLYPDAKGWLWKKTKGVMRLIDANEHMADAIAIGLAATKTAEFRAALSMVKKVNR